MAEDADSKPVKCGFESHPGHSTHKARPWPGDSDGRGPGLVGVHGLGERVGVDLRGRATSQTAERGIPAGAAHRAGVNPRAPVVVPPGRPGRWAAPHPRDPAAWLTPGRPDVSAPAWTMTLVVPLAAGGPVPRLTRARLAATGRRRGEERR